MHYAKHQPMVITETTATAQTRKENDIQNNRRTSENTNGLGGRSRLERHPPHPSLLFFLSETRKAKRKKGFSELEGFRNDEQKTLKVGDVFLRRVLSSFFPSRTLSPRAAEGRGVGNFLQQWVSFIFPVSLKTTAALHNRGTRLGAFNNVVQNERGSKNDPAVGSLSPSLPRRVLVSGERPNPHRKRGFVEERRSSLPSV